MNRKRRMFLLFAFVFLCTWFGFQAGTLAKGDEATRLAAYKGQKSSPAGDPSLPEEIRLLVVGVDRIADTPDPRLQSVWLAVNRPSQAALVWYGVYPAIGPESEKINREMESHFAVVPGQKIALEFQALLQTRHGLVWNGAILLDDPEIGRMIDVLDGIKLQGQAVTSRQVLAGLQVAANEPRTARMYQTEIIRGFCERRDELGGGALGKAVDLLVERLAPPPPGMWNEPSETAPEMAHRLRQWLTTEPFLPCEINDF